MTSGYPAFRALVERVRQGDHDAAVILVQHYGPDMLRVVRKYLAVKARCVLDSADVMQSAWRSFFTHGLFTQDFTDERELRHFLQRLSRSKVLNVNKRYLDSQRRDLRRACSLDDLSPEARQRLLDTGPSAAEATRLPGQVAMSATETLGPDRLLKRSEQAILSAMADDCRGPGRLGELVGFELRGRQQLAVSTARLDPCGEGLVFGLTHLLMDQLGTFFVLFPHCDKLEDFRLLRLVDVDEALVAQR